MELTNFLFESAYVLYKESKAWNMEMATPYNMVSPFQFLVLYECYDMH